jgi:hypothetical protein
MKEQPIRVDGRVEVHSNCGLVDMSAVKRNQWLTEALARGEVSVKSLLEAVIHIERQRVQDMHGHEP